MPAYKALFTFALKYTAPCSLSTPAHIDVVSPPQSHIKAARVEPVVTEGRLTGFSVTATYDSPALEHVDAGSSGDTIIVLLRGDRSSAYLSPAYEISKYLLLPLLYQLSALTIQPYIYWNVLESLGPHVGPVTWILPDGSRRPQIDGLLPSSAMPTIVDSGACAIEAQHFTTLEDIFNGRNQGAPLWRGLLADAHRARNVGLREVVIHAATALDVGVQPWLPPGEKTDMRVFRGELGKTPDLRLSDQPLFLTIARLWFSRHSIVHRGRADLFEDNPQRGAASLGPLQPQHTEAFLAAVPKAIAFIELNPP